MYAVLMTEIYRTQIVRQCLCATPHQGEWTWIALGDYAAALDLCDRMRRSRPTIGGKASDCAYTVVPVPAIG